MSDRKLTDDEIADFAFTRELRQIDNDIAMYQTQLNAAHVRRERLLTGEHSFKTYVKGVRRFTQV